MKTVIVVVIAAVLTVVTVWLCFMRKKSHKTEDPLLRHIHQRMIELDPIAKDVYLVTGDRSFTRNKKMISICTRRQDGSLYPMNDLMQVAVHELAHVKHDGDSSHHQDTWLAIFHDLLDRAHVLGICDKTLPVEENYCGTLG